MSSLAGGGLRPVPRLLAVLTIDRAIRDAIVEHARRDHPDEACGVVAGPIGSDRPERFIPMLNAAMSTTFYEFDSTDLLRLYREMDDNDEEPVVIYHSHTATEAYPSRTDIGLASEPNAHYVLVSTREHGNNEGPVEFRSYRIVDGEVTDAVLAEAQKFARNLADGPWFAHAMTKKMLDQEWAMGIDQMIEAEAQAQAICMATGDFRRAFEAFAAKAKPAFEGN